MAEAKQNKKVQTVGSWLRKELGEKTGGAILKQANRLARQGASPREIQKAVGEALSKRILNVQNKIVLVIPGGKGGKAGKR
jgi:hypothetical protein